MSVNSLELVTLLELVKVKLAFESSPVSISVQSAQPSVGGVGGEEERQKI